MAPPRSPPIGLRDFEFLSRRIKANQGSDLMRASAPPHSFSMARHGRSCRITPVQSVVDYLSFEISFMDLFTTLLLAPRARVLQ